MIHVPPRKQQKLDIEVKTSFRRECGPHHDPSHLVLT